MTELLRSDCYRYTRSTSWRAVIGAYQHMPGFRFLCWWRMLQALRGGGREHRGWLRNLVFRVVEFKTLRVGYRFGFDIPVTVRLGRGTKFGHFGGVVMSSKVELGENCLVSHSVTIGRIPRGKRAGTPRVGDRVYIGTGSVITGGIVVGNDSLIAPNTFVNFDVPDSAVVLGSPGKVVSRNGSGGYIRFLWQEAA